MALRAVKPDERATALSVSAAAERGTDRELLVAIRTRVAKAVEDDECAPRDLAALTRRLQEIAREIRALDALAEQEAVDSGVAPDEAWDAETL